MNIKQIKEKYTCLDYLGKPMKKTKNGFLYRAPWREDTHPSLSVTANGKGWHDLATGAHGSVIDLVMHSLNTTDVRMACEEILRHDLGSFSFSQQYFNDGGEKKEDSAFTFFKVEPLRARGLYAYLYNRKINIEIAKQFLKEAHYSFKEGDSYLYALAYPNDKGGYELRSGPYRGNPDGYKGSTAPKGITTHLGIGNAPTVVFEGFMDMLSFATLCGEVRHNYMVLNSIVNVPAAIEVLRPMGGKVLLCLDNDQGGDEATRQMIDALPGVQDIRSRFAQAKDVNEYLCLR